MEITYNKKWISHLGIMASALSSVHSFPLYIIKNRLIGVLMKWSLVSN